MKKATLSLALSFAVFCASPGGQAEDAKPTAASAGESKMTGAIADAAKKFLASLDDTQRGKVVYYISFLGQPSATEPWMIQFGGHHLAIDVTLAGEPGTLAPGHTAAQPATYEFEGKTVHPLGHETDKSCALFSSLDEVQRKKAVSRCGFVSVTSRFGISLQRTRHQRNRRST